MKKKIYFLGCFLTLLIFSSCSEKELKIPLLEEKGIQEIKNFSEVWFFLKTEEQDTIALINKNNTISSTHWVYNIDKRLPMHLLYEKLNNFKLKHANSLHSKPGMKDYFCYADTSTSAYSFIEFGTQTFQLKNHSTDVKNNDDKVIEIRGERDSVIINTLKYDKSHFKMYLRKELDSFYKALNKPRIKFTFPKNLQFQDYLYYKVITHNLIEGSSVKIDTIEIID